MKPKRTISYIPYTFCPNHTATIEALATARLSGREFRVVLLIMRQTDGYLREEDRISPGFFARKTGIGHRNTSRVLARLNKLGIVAITPGKPPAYSVNRPDRWNNDIFEGGRVESDADSAAKTGTIVTENDANARRKRGPSLPKTTRTRVENDAKQLPTKDKTKDNYYRKGSIDNNKYTRGKYGHMVRR